MRRLGFALISAAYCWTVGAEDAPPEDGEPTEPDADAEEEPLPPPHGAESLTVNWVHLGILIGCATVLAIYAGYIFLVVDRRPEVKALDDPELDDKTYDFALPQEIEDFEELKLADPAPEERELAMALLERAKAGIPLIEQLEKDHPRMARLFQAGLLDLSVWEQLAAAEAAMDAEVSSVQAEAEKLQAGWGKGVFSQAYQAVRGEREQKARQQKLEETEKREACTLSLTFTSAADGRKLQLSADGKNVSSQTPMKLRDGGAATEVPAESQLEAMMVCGAPPEERTYTARPQPLKLDAAKEKQWLQLGSDAAALRLQVKFLSCQRAGKRVLTVGDIRATVPADAE